MAIVSLAVIIKLYKKKYFYLLLFFIPIFLFWSVSSYFTIVSLAGWPTESKIQNEFTLHQFIIQEDVIYLWITNDGLNIPRSHKIKYDEKLHKKLQQMSIELKKGKTVKGKIKVRGNNELYNRSDRDILTFDVPSPKDILAK